MIDRTRRDFLKAKKLMRTIAKRVYDSRPPPEEVQERHFRRSLVNTFRTPQFCINESHGEFDDRLERDNEVREDRNDRFERDGSRSRSRHNDRQARDILDIFPKIKHGK